MQVFARTITYKAFFSTIAMGDSNATVADFDHSWSCRFREDNAPGQDHGYGYRQDRGRADHPVHRRNQHTY